ncbi:nuclear transport factor 2 family protein [Altibacter lentus]|uniref:nuclear transport factor 2 family protein n=1 Tax=Altibacter lentus TaxID=1223410 RepID=UPI00126840C4|nr:nuclear transport factor 2 family protein [Altibacter lentus]
MKIFFTAFCFFFGIGILTGQSNTDVFLLKVPSNDGIWHIKKIQNISRDPGYDSQPSFLNNSQLLFAGNNNGQTDIARYDLETSTKEWYNTPSSGGEYSPQRIPESASIAAVRLDTNGLQRLYRYEGASGKAQPTEMIQGLQVAYFAAYNDRKILASVLSDDRLDLVLIDLQKKTIDTLLQNSGRSIHKVPGGNSLSYTAVNDAGNHDIYLLDMDTKESFFVTELPVGIQDYTWLDASTMILGSGARLYHYDTFSDNDWQPLADLSSLAIKNISRLAASPDGKMLALVAEPAVPSSAAIVESHIEPFNLRDLEGFVNVFSEDVIVRRFPNKVLYTGKDNLRNEYQKFFDRTATSNVSVVTRITLKNTVIDEEQVAINGKTHRQVTIYEVDNGKIKSMTFIEDTNPSEAPEAIVQTQLQAYNDRDIDAFMATYAEDIELFNFPDTLSTKGKLAMRNGYAGFFAATPNLHCEIQNRIVIGNKVIDEEKVTVNDGTLQAIAIYEVADGRISKVTFIQ